jgi:glycosyltransferase involved in cell wall biosynthesis
MNSGLYKMKLPFFSIIIPTFNSEKTLKHCLNSIVSQTFHDCEILLIDGLSEDSTIDIIKEYSSNFTGIHWISQKDQGIYDAMNKGLKVANGEWIYFLGSDDKLASNKVLEQIYLFDKRGHNVVYGDVKIIGNTTWAKHNDIYNGLFDLQTFLKKNICHQAIFYNLKFLKKYIGYFNIDYKVCSDWDFNLRCWAREPLLHIDMIIADFYGGGLTTKTNKDDEFRNHFNINVVKYFGPEKLIAQLPSDLLSRFGISIINV